MLEGQNAADQEWAVIGSSLSVGYKPDKDSDACKKSYLYNQYDLDKSINIRVFENSF
jgi:hypothetical protein